jgi:hypothetical protein
MTYAVKTLYPEFKCLTAFRKVMKRIDAYNNKQRLVGDEKTMGNVYGVCHKINFYNDRNEVKIDRDRKSGLYVYNLNRYVIATHYEEKWHNSCFQEYYRALKKKDEEFISAEFSNYINYYSEDAKGDRQRFQDACIKNCPELYQIGKDGEYKWTNKGLKERWFMNEANKYDMMMKKWEFNEAMISRDYKTTTLCDDVIGLVFEYL